MPYKAMRDSNSRRYLLRAFGAALIVFGSINTALSVYTLADFNSINSFGGWWISASIIVMTFESLTALVLGMVALSRQNRLLLVLGLWSAVFLAVRFFRSISMFGLSLSNLSYMAWHFASPCAFLVAFVLLYRTRHSWNTSIAGPNCAQCRYNMSGLSEPRCPECGRVYTLDEFYQL